MRVDYPTIRNEIQDGDILLFRGKSWFSRLICWITRSPYSHSAILGWWNGHLMVLEAVPTGVVASRMSLVVSRYSGQIGLWTTDEELARFEVIRTAQLLLGKHASVFQALRQLTRRLFGRGRAPADPASPEAAPEEFVRSEFVRRVWRAGGVELAQGSPDMTLTPRDIANSPSVRKVGALVRGQPGKTDAAAAGPGGRLSPAWIASPPRARQLIRAEGARTSAGELPPRVSPPESNRRTSLRTSSEEPAARPGPGQMRHLKSVPVLPRSVTEPSGRFDSGRIDRGD